MGHTLTASGQRRGQGRPSLLAERTETALRLVIGRGHGEGDSLPGAPRTPPVRRRERLGRRRQLCQDPQEGEAPAMWLGSCHTPLVRPDTGELPGHCHSQDLTALGSRAGCHMRTPRTLAGPDADGSWPRVCVSGSRYRQGNILLPPRPDFPDCPLLGDTHPGLAFVAGWGKTLGSARGLESISFPSPIVTGPHTTR